MGDWPEPLLDDVWLISIQAWLIQDGQYPEIAIHDRLEFATVFGYRWIRETSSAVKSARHLGGNGYEVTAEAIAQSSESLALDCGIVITSYRPPPRVFGWVNAEVFLNVGENHHRGDGPDEDGLPGQCLWHVNRLWREMAPTVEVQQDLHTDEDAPSYESIAVTDAHREDVAPLASYLLECVPARHVS